MTTNRGKRYGRQLGPDDPAHVLSQALQALLHTQGLSAMTDFVDIAGRWPEIVAEPLASHSRPVRIEKRKLVVVADQAVWATQLRMLSAKILERLHTFLPRDAVEEIYVSVGRLSD